MMSVQEIETALRALPQRERWEVVHWLLEDLQATSPGQNGAEGSAGDAAQASLLPDYAARRRRIFGDKVLPNMVLAARAEERW